MRYNNSNALLGAQQGMPIYSNNMPGRNGGSLIDTMTSASYVAYPAQAYGVAEFD